MGIECADDENIIRGIFDSEWDQKNNRISKSIFKGPNTSVCRLAILPFSEIVKILKRDLHKPPEKYLKGAGEINIGLLKSIGKQHEEKPTDITVVSAPLPDNSSHAEIPQKLSIGLSRKIAEQLTIHRVDTNC